MKKFIVLTLCILQILTSLALAGTFSDVPPDHWAIGFISELSDKGIINGMGDGTFAPNGVLTKGQFMKLIMTASIPELNFTEIKGSFDNWAAVYIDAAENYNVLEKGEINISNVNDPISRIEVVTILGKCDINIRGKEQKSEELLPFNDISELDLASTALLAHSYKSGVIGGYPDGTFRPNNNLTRAEASKILSVYIGL